MPLPTFAIRLAQLGWAGPDKPGALAPARRGNGGCAQGRYADLPQGAGGFGEGRARCDQVIDKNDRAVAQCTGRTLARDERMGEVLRPLG